MNVETVIKENMGMVYYLSKKYSVGNQHEQEMRQLGRIGIANAVATFNEEKGGNLTSWIYTHIKKEMLNYVNNQSKIIRIPQSHLKNKDKDILPTEGYISSLDDLNLDGNAIYTTIAYEEGEDETLDDQSQLELDLLRHYLPKLAVRHQEVIRMRLNEDMTFVEIGEIQGKTYQAAKQQYDIAIKRLKKLITNK